MSDELQDTVLLALVVTPLIVVTGCMIVIGIRTYLHSTWKTFDEAVDLNGKTVLITGANSGIGEATAVAFAKLNARVIIACRSQQRGRAAQTRILSQCGRPPESVILKIVDVSSLASVRSLAQEVLENEERLDILVNNAGVSRLPLGKTAEGLEVTYATNFFGHFLLTNLLLGLMKKTKPEARVVNVTSFTHDQARLNVNNIEFDKFRAYCIREGVSHQQARGLLYCNSKLMINMITLEFARRLARTDVTVNCVCPGVVQTTVTKDDSWPVQMAVAFLHFFGKTPEEGAQGILHCALSSSLKRISGRYFRNFEQAESRHPMACDRFMCKRLWEISTKLTGLDRG